MITREELKENETYIGSPSGFMRTVLSIGDISLFFRCNEIEATYRIDEFLRDHSIIPKPKKKVKIVKYMDANEEIFECSSARFMDLSEEYKKLSEYEIEVEE